MAIIWVLGGLTAMIVGGKMGIRLLLYCTTGCITGYVAFSLNRTFFHPLYSGLRDFMNRENAWVVTFITLTFPSLLVIPYLGRIAIVRLKISERISPIVDALIGAFFLLTIYISIMVIGLLLYVDSKNIMQIEFFYILWMPRILCAGCPEFKKML